MHVLVGFSLTAGIDLDVVNGLVGSGTNGALQSGGSADAGSVSAVARTLAGPPMAPMGLPMMLAHTWLSSLPCGTLAAGSLPATG